MSVRVPLYAKILGWFFLNLALLIFFLFLFFKMQFHFGLDSLLLGQARERVVAISRVIASELESTQPKEWNAVLKRFGEAYGLEFFLFRNDGVQAGGDAIQLPVEVASRIAERRMGGGGGQGFGGGGGQGFGPGPGPRWRLGRSRLDPEAPRAAAPPPGDPATPEGRVQPVFPPAPLLQPFLVKTTEPNRYWAGCLLRTSNRPGPGLRPLVLVAMSEKMNGGLFFDFGPWITVGVGLLVFSVLFWFPFVRGLTRSISQMTQATEAIAAGRFDAQVAAIRRDELGRLGQAINAMSSRLAGFVRGQKRFLGDTAHELCSPLARIQLALAILEQRADEKQRAQVEDLREEVEHMSALVAELLSFSKASLEPAAIKLQPVPLADVVEEAVHREQSESQQIVVELPQELAVMADRELLLRSVANLVRNAVRYAGEAGPITISARKTGDNVELRVLDCGPGIPEACLAQIFDPFYRPEPSRDRQSGGAGLGLAIVKTCVEACGGSVSCRNRQPSGLEVLMRFKAA